jgi:transcriptional regulator with XRE-family HTH domain
MFGKRLREVRMKRKLTQIRVADAVGVALRTYQGYEQGEREPSLSVLVKLANALDITTDYLLGRQEASHEGSAGECR